jgi:hypothetical protein
MPIGGVMSRRDRPARQILCGVQTYMGVQNRRSCGEQAIGRSSHARAAQEAE